MSKDKPFSKLEQGCDECDKDESTVFRDGKIQLRFIRAKKKPVGAMSNYKDGEVYWMFPRHAKMPWWQPVDQIDYPIVPPATEKDSVFQYGSLNDMNAPAFLGKSGITIKPGKGIVGGFVEPTEDAQITMSDIPQVQGQEEPVGFPEESPTKDWTKEKLVEYIRDKGGFAKREMRKAWLLEIALNLS